MSTGVDIEKPPSRNRKLRSVARGVARFTDNPKGPVVQLGLVSGPARYFKKTASAIIADLGGRRELSRIELELVNAFSGASALLQSLNVSLALGDITEVHPATYSALASTMLRIGARLGFRRRSKEIEPTLGEVLRDFGNQCADAQDLGDPTDAE